jgi:phosphotransferase system enzyme I (PtsP)
MSANLRQAREIINREVHHLSRFGHGCRRGCVRRHAGSPRLMFDLDALMEAVDFVSVGSNDLFQFMTATDRGNPQIADRFEPLSGRS